MRTAAFTLILAIAFTLAAHSQKFSLLPQVGLETSRTSLSYNDGPSFLPLGTKFSPQASLRLNYTSKKGHGFFIGASTSQNAVVFSFADPETGRISNFSTARDMQLRVEGGYQFNSKPIALGKKTTRPSVSSQSKERSSKCGSYTRVSCQPAMTRSSGCGNKNARTPQKTSATNSWVRIQPSIGMGYMAAGSSEIAPVSKNGQVQYQYKAGNWNTAILAGTSFEFGRGKSRLFTVSIGYLKGLGNLDEETLVTTNASKTITTTISSKTSAWNLRVGIPFSLGGHAMKKTKQQVERKKASCQQYKIQYKCRGN